MNLQDLLNGVLSLGPGNRPPWQTSYLDPQQQQPAPQGALAAPQQAPAPPQGALALPQLPQPAGMAGNGMSPQGSAPPMGPGRLPMPGSPPPVGPGLPPPPMPGSPPPMGPGNFPAALQAPDDTSAPPQGALSAPAPAPDTAKAGDPHTRAKGILAAAVSGDPQAIQQAVMDPKAASQAGSQVPDGSNWNPGSAYDTPGAPPPPKNAADAQKQADAAHAQDKQQTFGQKALGVLSNPDTGLLLQSIGVGLLTSRNPWQGIGQGVQMYQQLHLKNQDRQLEAQRVAVQERRADTAEKQGQAQIDQGQQHIGLEKTDQELRRDQYAQVAKQQALQLGLEQSRAAEQARHDRVDEGLSGQRNQAELQRLRQGGDTPYNFGDAYYDQEGKALQQRRNQATGAVDYVDSSTGQVVQNPQGLQRAQDAITKSINSQEGKITGGILEAGQQAQTVKQRLGYARDLLNANPGLYTGTGGDAVQALRKIAVSLGVAPGEVDTVADADTLSNIAGQQMLSYVNQTKGSISNYEDKKFLDMSPGLTKSRQGNLRLIEMGYRAADRQVEKADFFAQHDNLPYRNVSSMWRDYEDKNPIFAGMQGFGATAAANGGNSVTVGGKTISYTVEK